MNRTEILDAAKNIVNGERDQQYGTPENSFEVIAELWRSYLKASCVGAGADVCILPEDVAAMMALLKIARISTGQGKADNWIDLAGYAACGGEIQTRGECGNREAKIKKLDDYCEAQHGCNDCIINQEFGGNPPCEFVLSDEWTDDDLDAAMRYIEEESKNGK